MADWPTLAELKAQLGISPEAELPDERTTTLTTALGAAIEQVQIDTTGLPDLTADPPEEPVEPTDSMSAAAMLLAVRVTKAPDAPFGVAAVFDSGGLYKATNDPDYRRLLKGHRSQFGVA